MTNFDLLLWTLDGYSGAVLVLPVSYFKVFYSSKEPDMVSTPELLLDRSVL